MSRAVTRLASLVALGLTALLTAGPAYADNPIGRQEGEEPGSLSALETVLLYVLIPLAVAFAVFLVVWLPGAVKANRYRPAQGWGAPPVWFAGPADPLTAVQSAETGDVVRGGASGSW